MAVPAHDERDFEFAKKFNIEITQVIDDTVQLKRIRMGIYVTLTQSQEI